MANKKEYTNEDIVSLKGEDRVRKVHVHTNDPGKAIQKGLEFGYINLPKIENMNLVEMELAFTGMN